MPAVTSLLVGAIVGAVLLRVAAHAMVQEPTGNPAVLIALELGILMAGIHLALRAARHPERYAQTITSLLGCQIVAAPALLSTRWLLLTYTQQQGGMAALAQMLFLVVAIWMLLVTVRILRSATQWPWFACVLLALAIEVATVLVAVTIYPTPTESTATPA